MATRLPLLAGRSKLQGVRPPIFPNLDEKLAGNSHYHVKPITDYRLSLKPQNSLRKILVGGLEHNWLVGGLEK